MAVSVFTFGGEELAPLADRALHWPATSTLILSDLHVGKSDVFRARGLPVPSGVTSRDLGRLATLIQQTSATRVLILGDFLHAKESHDALSHVEQWRRKFPVLDVQIVPGNHDRTIGMLDPMLKFTLLPPCHVERGIAFCHDPAEVHELPVMAGHVHPKARLSDFDGGGVDVPCFVIEDRLVILPAFGGFTGGCRIRHADGRRLLAAAAGRVVELLPERAPRSSSRVAARGTSTRATR